MYIYLPVYAEEGVMPGTPSDLEESANETNSNDASAACKKNSAVLPGYF